MNTLSKLAYKVNMRTTNNKIFESQIAPQANSSSIYPRRLPSKHAPKLKSFVIVFS